MTAARDIFQGLHVLLVSDDEPRAQALSNALRERKAHVGDLKYSGRDSLAVRGADLLVVDTRSADKLQAQVAEMQSDVRTRWASVARVDFAKLAPPSASVQLTLLEEAVKPLTSSDRALTERAKRDANFTTELSLLGPTRMLRALMHAGPTMKVDLTFPNGSASVTLSNELLVCAFLERGEGKWEAWKALARILGLTDANVSVTRLLHPAAMNVMEPLDQALQTAAQERQAATSDLELEEGRGSQVKMKPQGPANENAQPAAQEPAGQPAGKAGAPVPKVARPVPNRTLMGVAPVIAPTLAAPTQSSPSSVGQPAPTPAAKPAATRYTYQGDGAERVKPGRTMMGLAPGLPPIPAPPSAAERESATMREPPPPPPGRAPARDVSHTAPTLPEQASPFADRANAPGTARAPARGPAADSLPTMPPSADVEIADLPAAVPDTGPKFGGRRPGAPPRNNVSTVRQPRVMEQELRERLSVGDTPTDPAPKPDDVAGLEAEDDIPGLPPALSPDDDLGLPPAIHAVEARGSAREQNDEHEEATTVANGGALDLLIAQASRAGESLAESSAQAHDLGVAAARAAAPTRPIDSRAVLLDAIREEQSTSLPPGAVPLPERIAAAPKPEPILERAVKRAKSRAVVLSALLLLAAGELAYVYIAGENARLEEQHGQAPRLLAPPTQKRAPEAAPAAKSATPDVPVANAEPAAAPTPSKVEPAAGEAPTATAPKPEPAPEPAKVEPAKVEAAPSATAEPAPSAAEPAPSAAEPTNPGAASLDDLIRDGTKQLAEHHPELAKTTFESAVAMDGKNPHAQAGLGQALLDLGNFAGAQKAAEAAIRLRPKRAHYRVLLGDALKALGKPAEARAAWQKALEIDPADRDASKRLAQ